ncbi:MAG: hypothetical protein JXA20_13910 [Spirochaetes bacterium]|nr:hypothetical protein [Spirochaetota bacterium]
MERETTWRGALQRSAGLNAAIMLARPAALLMVQVLFRSLLGSWEATYDWWPLQMVLANIPCLFALLLMMHLEGLAPREVYCRPFPSGSWAGRLAPLLRGRGGGRWRGVLYDAGIFLAILCTLGLLAFILVRQMDLLLRTLPAFHRGGPLPPAARWAVTILLPLTMPLVEVPWYLGYFFPKLERLMGGRAGTARAFALVTAAFALQHGFQPLFADAAVTLLRFAVELPLILLAAWVMRAVPRFTPAILLLHGLMALQVVMGCWAEP